jgi:hypothetical protein
MTRPRTCVIVALMAASLGVSGCGDHGTAATVPIVAPVPVTRPEPSPDPTPDPDNAWPEAIFRTTPRADGDTILGTAPLAVDFNACRSVDPDGDPLGYRMDLDGDGVFESFGATGNDCHREAVYGVGRTTATVCVTDLDCPGWPLCDDYPRNHRHPYQCASYEVVATP